MKFPKFLKKRVTVKAIAVILASSLGLPMVVVPMITSSACQAVQCEE